MAGRIVKVAGPLVIVEGLREAKMHDVVLVSEQELVGEVIELKWERASVQVYEETSGLRPGESVSSTGRPLSVELGPGLVESIYDGIQRPLDIIRDQSGEFIGRGVRPAALNRERKWNFVPSVRKGDRLTEGDDIGTVTETSLVTLKIPVPPGLEGEVAIVREGEFAVDETVVVLKTAAGEAELSLMQRWPVRVPRPVRRKLPPREPLNTGQRVIDSLFPLAKGGTACVPGPFGSGKTIVQHQLAKWSDADIIIYIGCGERGNEMTDVLREFPRLRDPATGESLMRRTVLIANTSNMPVAAREASVYTGITIAEYFRDMGINVALMADSTSRWAEALREISGRQEEMPGDEGYPAYLGSRIAEFYERAGRVETLVPGREGTLSVIGAVSPPGGDLSDPVVQATLKVVKVFWGLDDKLAYRRHFPAINWLGSYSLYVGNLGPYFAEQISPRWDELRRRVMAVLQKESELEEVARLVGRDALSPGDQLLLETAKNLREDFLHQNAFQDEDRFTSLKKQHLILKAIMAVHGASQDALDGGASLEDVVELPGRRRLTDLKGIAEAGKEGIDGVAAGICESLRALAGGGAAGAAAEAEDHG